MARTAQQAAGVEESSAALQQLSVSVGQTAVNAEKASDEVRDTQQRARNSGEVVTKADILGHVWDYAFEGDPNIVEVYVGRLRRKVDRPFGREDIETLRGSGYRLRVP